MKRSKAIFLSISGMILLAVAIGAVCIGLRAGPTVNYALRISQLLQPVLNANNQTMHIAVSVDFGGKPHGLESDVYLVTEDGQSYLSIEQNGTAVYVADNVLFLENGKAFRIGDKLQAQTASCKDLLAHIGALYEALKITAEETEKETAYSITVIADQADTLLAAVSLGETLPVNGIEKLNVHLTERNEKLERITFSGNCTLDGTSVSLNVTLSGFRILASGDYPIPEEVKQSAATVDPNGLFSLTEDLYRLALALAPFADRESMDGTLELMADCGPIRFNTQMKLSDLKTTSGGQLDPEKLQALPEVLGWLCMEGEISCTQSDDGYVYALGLDQSSMKELSGMIHPELSRYSGDLTEGRISIILEDRVITSMRVSIHGKISALIVQIPIEVEAVFTFA